MEREEAGRKTALHTPHSRKTWVGGTSRRLAMEQFPAMVDRMRGQSRNRVAVDLSKARRHGHQVDRGIQKVPALRQNRVKGRGILITDYLSERAGQPPNPMISLASSGHERKR